MSLARCSGSESINYLQYLSLFCLCYDLLLMLHRLTRDPECFNTGKCVQQSGVVLFWTVYFNGECGHCGVTQHESVGPPDMEIERPGGMKECSVTESTQV